MNLTRDSILSALDSKLEAVDVPEWGGTVYIRTMSGAERDKFEVEILDAKGKVTADNIRAKLLAKCLSDEKGTRLFSDADVEALGGKSANVLERLWVKARKLNALSKEDVDELVKN